MTSADGSSTTAAVAARAELLHETAMHHGSFEAVAPPHDWWDWYAAYMLAREAGSSFRRGRRGRRALHGGGQARRGPVGLTLAAFAPAGQGG